VGLRFGGADNIGCGDAAPAVTVGPMLTAANEAMLRARIAITGIVTVFFIASPLPEPGGYQVRSRAGSKILEGQKWHQRALTVPGASIGHARAHDPCAASANMVLTSSEA